MAELVDALASGASVGNNVEVQVLSRAPRLTYEQIFDIILIYVRIRHRY